MTTALCCHKEERWAEPKVAQTLAHHYLKVKAQVCLFHQTMLQELFIH